MKKKSVNNRQNELVSPSNKTVYLFEEGMTSEEQSRGVKDVSYQRIGGGTAFVGQESYKIIKVSSKPHQTNL